jgi:hypothetical protein
MALGFVGCMTGAPARLPASRDTVPEVSLPDRAESRITRSQRPDGEPPAPPPAEALPGDRTQVRVRAWVNGKPVFDDEVMLGMAREARNILAKGKVEQIEYRAKVFNEVLNGLIDRELILQDAFGKLEKNPKMLDKVRQAAAKTFDKKLAKIVADTKSDSVEGLKRLIGRERLETMRRQDERDFIASEYVRSRIFPHLRVSHQDLWDYYQSHLSEFRTVDRVKWQNIFIAVGSNHPTPGAARRFAEDILARVRAGEDFGKFLHYDEGTSWQYRKGEGQGSREHEVSPPELRPLLFRMRDGEVGPPVEIGTGVHLFRLVKRDHAGQLPFDDKVQTQISNKLKNEIFEREYKRIVKELRERAQVEIMRPGS